MTYTDDITANVEIISDNREPRCPCLLLLDTSASMSGGPIDELNSGLRLLIETISSDALASLRAEIGIVSFGGQARLIRDFSTVDSLDIPSLTANGGTPMGEAINLGLDAIESRKKVYNANGLPYYRPWVFLITDGEPNQASSLWPVAIQRVHEFEAGKKINFFSVGVSSANTNLLSQLSNEREPLMLQGINFKELFVWLSNSMISLSDSKPNDEASLPPVTWAKVGT